MLLLGRNKVPGWIRPMGLVFATCALKQFAQKCPAANRVKKNTSFLLLFFMLFGVLKVEGQTGGNIIDAIL